MMDAFEAAVKEKYKARVYYIKETGHTIKIDDYLYSVGTIRPQGFREIICIKEDNSDDIPDIRFHIDADLNISWPFMPFDFNHIDVMVVAKTHLDFIDYNNGAAILQILYPIKYEGVDDNIYPKYYTAYFVVRGILDDFFNSADAKNIVTEYFDPPREKENEYSFKKLDLGIQLTMKAPVIPTIPVEVWENKEDKQHGYKHNKEINRR